eukprot:4423280-Pleurochrysis_carterae.AAC.1
MTVQAGPSRASSSQRSRRTAKINGPPSKRDVSISSMTLAAVATTRLRYMRRMLERMRECEHATR